ncbi:hypothetical protein P3T35_003210 [Kitasatospora sp. GP30]|nr:hypothetical protein [Kitasatospora sp. GP30]
MGDTVARGDGGDRALDIATLKNADLVALQGAQSAYAQLVTAFGHHVDDWRSQVTGGLDKAPWTGSTAVQVRGDLATFDSKLQAAHDELNLVSATLADAEKSFAIAQAQLIQALDDAQAAHLTVNPDGSMTWDNEKSSPTYAGDDAQAKATEIGSRITQALDEAAQADQLISSRLKHFNDNATSGTGLDSATAGADQQTENNRENIPQQGTDPNKVKAWWNGLTPAEQQDLINNHPQDIGNLDGIPSASRDQANRIGLTRIQSDLQAKIAALGPEPPMFDGLVSGGFPIQTGAYTEWKQKHDALQGQLDQYNHIQDRLTADDQAYAKDPSSHPRDYLLGISTQGQGRAILSFGNPDTAKNVSAYVPGVTTTLDSLRPMDPSQTPGENEADNALSVWTAADRRPGGHPTASIVWLNYDPPSSLTGGMDTGAADAGAPTYAKFLTGIRDTHQGAPPHVTSIGDSYGSYVATESAKLAADQPGTYSPPDDLVLTGSPGVPVAKASDLHMNGHVWVGTSPLDPVHLITSGTPAGLGPADPADPSWGGNNFTVANGTIGGLGGDNHTAYLTQRGGPSLPNIANIVTGNYGDVNLEPPRE